MSEIEVYLASSGNIPGLPGNHGPGLYLIDYEERTIRPKPLEQSEALDQLENTPVASLSANDEVSGEEEEGSVAPEASNEPEATPNSEAQQPIDEVAEPASTVVTQE